MTATLIYAGLRREELLWLTQEDIDWDSKPYGLIRVRAKDLERESWQPKTRINRVVPISSDLRPYLDKQRQSSGDGPWFFRSPEGKRGTRTTSQPTCGPPTEPTSCRRGGRTSPSATPLAASSPCGASRSTRLLR